MKSLQTYPWTVKQTFIMFMKLCIDAESLQAASVCKSTSEEEEKAASESSRYGVVEVVCGSWVCLRVCVCVCDSERERARVQAAVLRGTGGMQA